jgi:translation initiation factor IF-1
MDRDRIELEGVVTDSCKGKFTVKITDTHSVLAVLSGKIRQNEIKILLGDKVRVEVSEYDTNQGRIVSRMRA